MCEIFYSLSGPTEPHKDSKEYEEDKDAHLVAIFINS